MQKLKVRINVSVKIFIKHTYISQLVKLFILLFIPGVPVEFPLPERNACESGLSCPLAANQVYLYKATLPILGAYPDIEVIVEWALNDATSGGNNIFCFEIPIKVVG